MELFLASILIFFGIIFYEIFKKKFHKLGSFILKIIFKIKLIRMIFKNKLDSKGKLIENEELNLTIGYLSFWIIAVFIFAAISTLYIVIK